MAELRWPRPSERQVSQRLSLGCPREYQEELWEDRCPKFLLEKFIFVITVNFIYLLLIFKTIKLRQYSNIIRILLTQIVYILAYMITFKIQLLFKTKFIYKNYSNEPYTYKLTKKEFRKLKYLINLKYFFLNMRGAYFSIFYLSS